MNGAYRQAKIKCLQCGGALTREQVPPTGAGGRKHRSVQWEEREDDCVAAGVGELCLLFLGKYQLIPDESPERPVQG